VTAQHIRFPDKEFMWLGDAKNVQLFGQHLWGDGRKMLVITEGEIDAMSVSQMQGHRYPVVSVPSGAQGARKAIKAHIDWLETFERVVFAFDSDEPGQAAALECATLLKPGKAFIAHLPLKDASEMLQASKIEETINSLWQAKPYRPDGIVSGKDLLEDILREPAQGYMLPYPLLDQRIRGLRKGELCLFTAGSGVGKSTLVHEIGYWLLMEHGLSLGIMALEESKKLTAERYISIRLCKPVHITREGTTEDEMKSAFDEVLNNDRFWLYDHFGSTDIEGLLNKIRYMAVALEIDFLILDHISIVVSGLDETGETERKTIDRLMTALRSLVEETGIGVMAIVHLKRRERGTPFTEGGKVSLSDLRGSGGLEQLSDTVIALERDQQDEEKANLATLRVLKNRHTGNVGVCDVLSYDGDTGRLDVVTPFDGTDF
jgi:twinkle protein